MKKGHSSAKKEGQCPWEIDHFFKKIKRRKKGTVEAVKKYGTVPFFRRAVLEDRSALFFEQCTMKPKNEL